MNRGNAIRQKKESYNNSGVFVKKDTKSDTASTVQDVPFFNKNTAIQILSLYKTYDPKSSTYDSTTSTIQQYHDWTLNKGDILYILKYSKPISGTELDLSYLVLPFWYKGRLTINGKQGTYKINAASFAILQFKDTTIYLGYTQKNNNKYFIVPPDSQ